jgi:hypothetical protein
VFKKKKKKKTTWQHAIVWWSFNEEGDSSFLPLLSSLMGFGCL